MGPNMKEDDSRALRKAESALPEFEEFVNSFDREISRMEENSNSIFDKVNLIKNIREGQKVDGGEEESSPAGLIETLWHLLYRMRRVNEHLEKSREGLSRFIG